MSFLILKLCISQWLGSQMNNGRYIKSLKNRIDGDPLAALHPVGEIHRFVIYDEQIYLSVRYTYGFHRILYRGVSDKFISKTLFA